MHIARQFVLYALCGFAAYLTHTAIVYFLGYTFFPAFGEALSDATRHRHSALNNTVAFFFSNATAYLLNIRYVFSSGRHARHKEVFFFFLASGVSFFPAFFSLKIIILRLGLNSHLANLAFVATAALFNFDTRKLFIFKK